MPRGSDQSLSPELGLGFAMLRHYVICFVTSCTLGAFDASAFWGLRENVVKKCFFLPFFKLGRFCVRLRLDEYFFCINRYVYSYLFELSNHIGDRCLKNAHKLKKKISNFF